LAGLGRMTQEYSCNSRNTWLTASVNKRVYDVTSRAMSHLTKAIGGLATALLCVVACLLGWLQFAKSDEHPFLGTTVGGYLPDTRVDYVAWLNREATRRNTARVALLAPSQGFERSLEELGVEVDIRAMLVQAERQRESGNLVSQLERLVAAKLQRQDLVWLTRFNEERARVTLQGLAIALEVPAINAEVDLVKRRRVRARPGSRLDVDATLLRIRDYRHSELAEVELVMAEVPPTVTEEQLTPVDLGKILASFETDFRSHAGPRAINIRVAARALNGFVIGPGEVMSFNHVVGPRVESRGFREAPVIVDDELEPGVGGGVCQVATTVHAAAVLAGFDIVERRSHSRPSAYAPMGLDATVIDGKVDLRFRNPYRVPLLISTSFPETYRLRVEVVGILPPQRYEHSYAVEKRYDYYRRVVTKAELAVGAFQRKQKGNFGFDVTSSVKGIGTHGPVVVRRYRSKYWPVPEVYWVGPDTDLRVLPPLPDGAIGVQRDGVTVFGQIPKEVEARATANDPDSGDAAL